MIALLSPFHPLFPLGGYIYIGGTAGATNLVSLLKNNAPAQPEVTAFSQFWVFNGMLSCGCHHWSRVVCRGEASNCSTPILKLRLSILALSMLYLAVPGVASNCLAVNKNTGKTDWIPCATLLPTVCFNSVFRRVLLFDDTSRQIKVNTPTGQIQGWRDQNAFRFLGIPYAQAPVGNLRFAAPVAKPAFTSTWDGLHYGGICPQTAQSAGFIPLVLSFLENGAAEKEDCLNLNVYTPSLKGSGQAPLPVMVYLHGGGFTTYVV